MADGLFLNPTTGATGNFTGGALTSPLTSNSTIATTSTVTASQFIINPTDGAIRVGNAAGTLGLGVSSTYAYVYGQIIQNAANNTSTLLASGTNQVITFTGTTNTTALPAFAAGLIYTLVNQGSGLLTITAGVAIGNSAVPAGSTSRTLSAGGTAVIQAGGNGIWYVLSNTGTVV